MRQIRTAGALLRTTEAALALSSTAYSDTDRQQLAEEAMEFAQDARSIVAMQRPTSKDRVNAARFLPNVPLLLNIKTFQNKPAAVVLQRAFAEHYGEITQLYQACTESQGADTPEYQGLFAESYVLLSLQRYALTHFPAMDWVPTPAIAHEESAFGDGMTEHRTWDISIFTSEPEPTYKIQVKRGNGPGTPIHQDDIDMIHARQDLAFPHERGNDNLPYVSVSRLMREITPTESVYSEQRWDARIEKIIDILG